MAEGMRADGVTYTSDDGEIAFRLCQIKRGALRETNPDAPLNFSEPWLLWLKMSICKIISDINKNP